MALPNEFTVSGKTTSVAKKQADIDDFAMELLQSLFSQQDEHQRVVGQLELFTIYWDKQQTCNQYAMKSKDLKEKVRQVHVKHEKQNEERRIQKVMMQHQYQIQEEQSRREQSMEMQKVRQQMTEHRQKWKGVIDDLNSHQAAMHAHLSGRIVTKEGKQQQWHQNKEVLKTLMHKLQQRLQQKQVCLLLLSLQTFVIHLPHTHTSHDILTSAH